MGELYYAGSIEAPDVLADIVESIAAAVYVDCDFNLETLWEVNSCPRVFAFAFASGLLFFDLRMPSSLELEQVMRGMLEPIITLENWDEQPVTALTEFCQKRGKSVEFEDSKEGQTNVMKVFVDGELIGIGSAEQKLIAKLNAARDALEKLLCSEAEHMDTEPCLPGGVGAGELIERSKQKLNELCIKNRWPRPVYK